MAKKTVITYDMVKERTTLPKDEQAKLDKRRKVGMALGITGGVLLLGGLAGMVTYFALHKDPQTEYVVKEVNKYTDKDNLMLFGELFNGVEITLTVKEPSKSEYNEKLYTFTEDTKYSTTDELAKAISDSGIKVGAKLNKEQHDKMILDYQFNVDDGLELTAFESQELIKSVITSATSGNKVSQSIFDKLENSRSVKNKSSADLKEYYLSKENPNKINIEVTPAEFKQIVSNLKTNNKSLLNKLNKINSKINQPNLKTKNQNNFIR